MGVLQLLRAPLGRESTPLCTASIAGSPGYLVCVSSQAHGQPALNGKHLSPPAVPTVTWGLPRFSSSSNTRELGAFAWFLPCVCYSLSPI